jgi:hypothetical protein
MPKFYPRGVDTKDMSTEEAVAKGMLLGMEFVNTIYAYRRRCEDQSNRFVGCAYYEYVDADDHEHVIIERRSEVDRPLSPNWQANEQY